MEILKRVEGLVFESRPWKLVLVVCAITLVKTGVWYVPNLGCFQAMAQNPFVNPFDNPHQHYMFWSWLGPFLAWAFHATSKWSFFLFHLAFSIAFTLLFIKVVFSRFSDRSARTSLILFSLLPVSATAYFWVGYDSITLFVMLLALAWPRYAMVTFVAGVALGMQHFEQSVFAAGGLLFAILLSRKCNDALGYSAKFCIALLLGVLAGKLALIGLFKHFAIEVNSGRYYALKLVFHTVLKEFGYHPHYIIWSVLGLGWLAALKYIDRGRKAIPFFATLLGLCLLLPITEDQTRVIAVATFPLIVVYWLFNEEFLSRITTQEVSAVFVMWIIVLWGWTWSGLPKWSVFPFDVVSVLHKLFGWFNVPPDPSLWPF